MSALVKEVYDAFREAGVSEDVAADAAQAVFSRSDNRFDRVDGRLDRVDGRLDEIDRRIAKVDSDLRVIKWMTGLIFVVVILPMLKGWLA